MCVNHDKAFEIQPILSCYADFEDVLDTLEQKTIHHIIEKGISKCEIIYS